MKIMLDENAIMPVRALPGDAGLDIMTPITFVVPPDKWKIVDTGVHVLIPYGFVGLLTSKSGLMAKGITTAGTIDNGYTGSIRAVVYNHSDKPMVFERGQKITQLVVMPILLPYLETVDSMPATERGDNGFGSTGV